MNAYLRRVALVLRFLCARLRAMLAPSPRGAALPQWNAMFRPSALPLLQQEKRRLERLLAMTTKIVKPGPMKTAMGRPTKKKRTRSTKKSVDKQIERDQPSMSTTDGAAAP